jgi:hypothetical protein
MRLILKEVVLCIIVCTNVTDPYHFDADPDPACPFDADPDPDLSF